MEKEDRDQDLDNKYLLFSHMEQKGVPLFLYVLFNT